MSREGRGTGWRILLWLGLWPWRLCSRGASDLFFPVLPSGRARFPRVIRGSGHARAMSKPRGASSNPSNRNPGETVHPTNV